jgi:integrase
MKTDTKTSNTKWIKKWNSWISRTKVPGVWKNKEGGFLVRGRTKDPTTGKPKEIRKVLLVETEATALKWLEDELAKVRKGVVSQPQAKTRFCDFAVSLLEEKLTLREIKSARGRERWVFTLRHLIGGTGNVKGFGEMFIAQIKPAHIEEWKLGVARLINEKRYRPATTNGWFAILRVILKAAKVKRLLKYDPSEGIKSFDTSEHPTYTEEEPNALTKEEMHEFLACMYELFPQHYAMTCLGYATGLRPSSLRCLRRTGKTPDILWDEGVILVRRSATLGEVMDTTKTKYRQRISVAPGLMSVLRWHVEQQLRSTPQKESELLFPSDEGELRSEACLRRAFAEVGTRIGLQKKFTPKGLRRTFNDAARIADLEGVVTMSISGHRTERMRDLYSSVGAQEQRDGIGKVLKLADAFIPATAAKGSGMPRGMHTPEEVCIREEPVREAV